MYHTKKTKFSTIVTNITEHNQQKQPILINTTNIKKNKYLSQQLQQQNMTHEILNTKHHEQKTAIITQTNRKNTITITTNMAGHKTNIILNNNTKFITIATLKQQNLNPTKTPKKYKTT